MAAVLTEDEILSKITDYVSREFLRDLDDGPDSGLSPVTPLLQSGILNSQNTGRLLAFVLDEFGVAVPPVEITGRNFRDLSSISALVAALNGA